MNTFIAMLVMLARACCNRRRMCRWLSVPVLTVALVSFVACGDVGTWTKADWPFDLSNIGRGYCTVLNGRLYVLAGGGMYSSSDGREFAFGRIGANAISGTPCCMTPYDNEIWLACDDATLYSSVDGVSWSSHGVIDHLPVSIRRELVPFGGKLWRLGYVWENPESDNTILPLKWTTDGDSWTEVADLRPWNRTDHTGAVFKGRMWSLGGKEATWPLTSSLWSSEDGEHWTASPEPPWGIRHSHATVVAGNRMWVLGGYNGRTNENGSWYTEDGDTWVQADPAPWEPRYNPAAVVFDNKLWVIGGSNGSGAASDAWYLELPPLLTISESPRGGWVEASEPWKLSAAVTGGSGPITYQWKKDNVDIPDATDATYDIASLSAADTGWYVCEITDSAKTTVQTTPVYLEVFPYGSLPAAGPIALLFTAAGCLLLPLLRRRKAM